MGDKTGIAWTNRTWNPWRGCTKIHARCKLCYMFTEQTRYGKRPIRRHQNEDLGEPLRWQRYAREVGRIEMVFTCSWSDWFHADADQWRDEAWAVIKACPNLTFQVLTKRPERIADHLPKDWGDGYPNVWLGSSLDPQDKNGMELFNVPAKVRFLSLEPLLAPVDLSPAIDRLDWVIVGGESGQGARPCYVQWVRDVSRQCKAAGVPVFVKQLGKDARDGSLCCHGCTHEGPHPLGLKHPKGGDMAEWPEDLQVRRFPV
jgi:protein gp37